MATDQGALYLEYGGDFQLNSNGGLVTAYGWDEVRQRIERRLLTNAQGAQTDGTPIPADYIFHPTYGISARARVGDVYNNDNVQALEALINQGVLTDAGVNTTVLPQISYAIYPQAILFLIYVTLASGVQKTIAAQISANSQVYNN